MRFIGGNAGNYRDKFHFYALSLRDVAGIWDITIAILFLCFLLSGILAIILEFRNQSDIPGFS
jgi:hypothetical protein